MAEKKESKFRTSIPVKLLIGLVTIISIVFMFPKGESIESEVSEGTVWTHDDLIAPFSFPILKDPVEYQSEIRAAAESVFPVYKREENGLSKILDSLESYNRFLTKVLDTDLSSDTLKNVNPTFLSSASFNKFLTLRKQERSLSQNRRLTLKSLSNKLGEIFANIYRTGIIGDEGLKTPEDSIAVRTGNIDHIELKDKFYTIDNANETIQNNIAKLNYPQDIGKALTEYALHFVTPNIVYNKNFTDEEIEQAKNNVSRYSGIVNENERIIAKHDRVTPEIKLKIDSYKAAKGEKIGYEGYFLQMIGKFLHVSFLITLFSIYLFLFRKQVFFDNLKLTLIAILFMFLSFVTHLINYINVSAPIQLLIFIPTASMLLTIIFDSRVGFYGTVILSLITGALRGNDYSFAAMNIFAGALSVYTVRDIKNRSQIFRSFLFILLGYLVSVAAFGLERFASVDSILIESAFVGSNALISPVLTYGILIFFERIFKITTDLTLLELSNFDRPLLKDLSRKAPGTFNHSMTMGTLAEAAAEAIKANPLLSRVGAYYHDIGKTLTPQNFVENQLNTQNVHEKLAPEESVQLILRHVIEGMELAEKSDLPQEIVDFIPMHHGTMTISYFYEKAKKLYGEEKVNIEDYRYPGPKPNSKETAIVMLADGCESSVRSIEDPDTAKVENVINKIIKSRVDEGQLDNAPLTFSDLSKIKESFISILLGQHHRRIRYPKQDEMEKGETKAENDQ